MHHVIPLSCDRRNHFDCLHTEQRAQGESSYFSLLDHPEDLRCLADEQDFLVGWTVVAQAVREGIDLSESIVYMEEHGCIDACDLGMRAAILEAYGLPAREVRPARGSSSN